jgi:hypothetical protein
MRMSQHAAAVSGLTALTIALAAGAASAHVTANPSTAVPGSFSGLGLAAGLVGLAVGAYGLTRKRAA